MEFVKIVICDIFIFHDNDVNTNKIIRIGYCTTGVGALVFRRICQKKRRTMKNRIFLVNKFYKHKRDLTIHIVIPILNMIHDPGQMRNYICINREHPRSSAFIEGDNCKLVVFIYYLPLLSILHPDWFH